MRVSRERKIYIESKTLHEMWDESSGDIRIDLGNEGFTDSDLGT
jgi:hypothetical protein